MRPLQISADTALKLSKALGVPVEQLMHMPQHILLKQLAELAQADADSSAAKNHTSAENSK
ncbi:YycC family protein [Paenibacillus apiarius]|uniref:YycC family protein n=1 Tax=Paenibacillus apiarius TaxID=46240 RepID=A0ABT4E0D9_9BACL|nr:YycC family protein [Paenibacillus apiarius]MBN3525430.1 YycC family protein [Paenibacillus apiarius]MCY9512722.1 YycC family protein [Paenibacillus apiarius]MCY9523062.1 YycC family protein [Paenibacillus apiarius]MCY9555185.1 YycC family protein [Paenibacillus apiarius]MCY9556500.1 YycC family protein [Paenibacillus apiarius]